VADPVFTFPADEFTWVGYQAAVRDWLVASTGIPTERVIMSNQNGPRPAVPFAEVAFDELVPLGAVDAVDQSFDASGDPGAEVTITSHGVRDQGVRVRVYTDRAVGDSSARVLLARAQAVLALPGARAGFHAAGATVWDRGTVAPIPAVLDTRWEGRAELEIRLYVEVQATEQVGYIETLVLTDAVTVPESDFEVSGG